MDIGARINKRLSEIGMTQAALAKRLKTSETTVSHWMTGKFRPASRYLRRLAEELQTSTSYLSGETDNPDTIEALQLGLDLQPGVGPQGTPVLAQRGRSEQPDLREAKYRIVDYSLQTGAWGVSVERRMAGGMEIKLEAPSGAEQKIKALFDAIWEIIGGGYVAVGPEVSQSNIVHRKRTEAHLLVESLNEEQLDRLNESLKKQLGVA